MVIKKAAEWNPELSVQDFGPTERSVGQKKDGKMTSMTSSNKYLKRRKMKNQSKEGFKTTTPGSILPVTGKDGLDLKNNTQ